jgi:hypothetical protein
MHGVSIGYLIAVPDNVGAVDGILARLLGAVEVLDFASRCA